MRTIFRHGLRGEKWEYLRARVGIVSVPYERDPIVWVHAVSVGEVNAATPLVNDLITRYPEFKIVLSTTTATGASMARAQFSDRVRYVYFPIDIQLFICWFLESIKPSVFIMIETELWPNLLAACKKRNIPTVLANARLSDKAYKSYRRIKGISHTMVSNLSLVLARSDVDAKNFIGLGMLPEKVFVVGNLKFDNDFVINSRKHDDGNRKITEKTRPIVCFGSVQDGEERILGEAMISLRELFVDVLFVFVPRHPEKAKNIARYLNKIGMNTNIGNYVSFVADDRSVDTYIVDSLGELIKFYAESDVAFVGGSLVKLGGQNVLEPIFVGTTVLSGPSLYNFQEISDSLIAIGALTVVAGISELVMEIQRLLLDEEERLKRTERGVAWLLSRQGASQRSIDKLANLLRTL